MPPSTLAAPQTGVAPMSPEFPFLSVLVLLAGVGAPLPGTRFLDPLRSPPALGRCFLAAGPRIVLWKGDGTTNSSNNRKSKARATHRDGDWLHLSFTDMSPLMTTATAERCCTRASLSLVPAEDHASPSDGAQPSSDLLLSKDTWTMERGGRSAGGKAGEARIGVVEADIRGCGNALRPSGVDDETPPELVPATGRKRRAPHRIPEPDIPLEEEVACGLDLSPLADRVSPLVMSFISGFAIHDDDAYDDAKGELLELQKCQENLYQNLQKWLGFIREWDLYLSHPDDGGIPPARRKRAARRLQQFFERNGKALDLMKLRYLELRQGVSALQEVLRRFRSDHSLSTASRASSEKSR